MPSSLFIGFRPQQRDQSVTAQPAFAGYRDDGKQCKSTLLRRRSAERLSIVKGEMNRPKCSQSKHLASSENHLRAT